MGNLMKRYNTGTGCHENITYNQRYRKHAGMVCPLTRSYIHGPYSDPEFRVRVVPALALATAQILVGRGAVRVADLDDVAQEVFLRLLRYETAEVVQHPQAYIFKMAANVTAEWAIRSRHRCRTSLGGSIAWLHKTP